MASETEVLDVAPAYLLHGISTKFIHMLPLSDELRAKAPVMNFHWITEIGGPAHLTSNMKVEATVRMRFLLTDSYTLIHNQHSFETAPKLDIVIIDAYQLGYTPTEAELAYFRKAHDECTAFLAVCGGFMPAQLAGILAGKTATAPRPFVPMMQKEDPRTT